MIHSYFEIGRMNIERLKISVSKAKLWQQPEEWQSFLEFAEAYFKNRGVEHPIVVELGVANNCQKKFYEEFLGAEHIGIDNALKYNPDIHGDTHSEETLNKLKRKLGGRLINLLFIDADHHYQSVKRDYEMYEPLTEHIVAFHDVMHHEANHEVRILFGEIMRDEGRYMKVVFSFKPSYMGIGAVVKK